MTASGFGTKLQFEDDGGLPFTLIQPLVYTSALLSSSITVPLGFKTDLASIPRPLWSVLPPVGKYDAAAVVHDCLYQFNGVTRKQADDVLREAMAVLNVSRMVRYIIYLGVRMGGWRPWSAYRRRDTQ